MFPVLEVGAMGQCNPKFEPTIDIGCLIETFTEIRTNGISARVGKNALWVGGCLLERFDGDEANPVPATDESVYSIFTDGEGGQATALSIESNVQDLAGKIVDDLKEAQKQVGFGSAQLTPAQILMILQAIQGVIAWFQARK